MTSMLCLVILCLPLVSAVDYISLQSLGAACSDGRDSCVGAGRRNFTSRNCECDRQCPFFGDCCVDARSRSTSASMPRRRPSCFGFSEDAGAYMVGSCPSAHLDREVRRKCVSPTPSDLKDPLMSAPTTHLSNRVTYRNRYCAECNAANSSDLKSWLIVNECPSLSEITNLNQSFAWRNLRFSSTRSTWGVDVGDTFHSCEVGFVVPEYLRGAVRLCRPDLVGECPPRFNRASVKEACGEYEAAVYHQTQGYKNAHCALCNGVAIDLLKCTSTGVTSRGKKRFTFAMLLDVNQSDGGMVGGAGCTSGQKYDPYFKRCRPLVCALPGYKMVNGQCKRQ